MARVLIVGCGCRGRALAGALVAEGHAVRGTSRSPDGLAAIEGAGHEGVLADPDRLGTLLPALAGVSAAVWLMATASGQGSEELHGARLRSFVEKLVDTPVRGFVYEAAGTVERRLLVGGVATVIAAGERFRMPVGVLDTDPADLAAWLAAASAAVTEVVSAQPSDEGA